MKVGVILYLLLSFTLFLFSCSDDFVQEKTTISNGVSVSFTVNDIQQEAIAQKSVMTRGFIVNEIIAQDLEPKQYPFKSSNGLSGYLIETTVEGVNPVQQGASTRANIKTHIDEDFTTLGYRSASASFSNNSPAWFYNEKTRSTGELYRNIYWDWDLPYGRFFAIFPEVSTESKITLSPPTYSGVPYLTFEVNTDVEKQKDLMTACSGEVHYSVRGTAPENTLNFRHALTAVRFAIGKNLSWDKVLDRVEIRNAMSKGVYLLSNESNGVGAHWKDLSAPNTFVLSSISINTKGNINTIITGKDDDNYTFYMLPQVLTDKGVIAHFHFTDGSEMNIPLRGSWKAGTTKTYKLSEGWSNWDYILEVTNPAPVAYDKTSTGSYRITSYRMTTDSDNNEIQQPVSWKIVGYSTDLGNTWTENKPEWLTDLSLTQGEGGTAAQEGTATLRNDVVDFLAQRNNELKNSSMKGSATNYYNLANATGASVIENTANSYLISAPGYYKIPFVYGNAIKNGGDNYSAYRTSNEGVQILKVFKDHLGNDIKTPYINVQNESDKITNASVLWSDIDNVISNVQVHNGVDPKDDYVAFQVTKEELQNGNAVIVARNSSGVAMWSWHLWFAPPTALNKITCTNYQNKEYNFTEETLGWAYSAWEGSNYSQNRVVQLKVQQENGNGGYNNDAIITITQTAGQVKKGHSTLYQFGRKDAFPGTSSFSPQNAFKVSNKDMFTIQDFIQYPENFYASGNESRNNNLNFYNLWSMDNRTSGYNDNTIVKTIYDPCPVGFSMPPSNAFTGFSRSGDTGIYNSINTNLPYNFGYVFNNKITEPTTTIYFPATGYRYSVNGKLENTEMAGYYWSAIPFLENGWLSDAAHLSLVDSFDSKLGFIYPGRILPKFHGSKKNGFAVRPIESGN